MIEAEGYYDGTIRGVEIYDDNYNKGALQFAFQVDAGTPPSAVTCRHSTGSWTDGNPTDDAAKRFASVLKLFGLDGIKQAPKLAELAGREVRIRAKLNQKGTKMNFYLATDPPPLSDSDVNAKLARLAGEADEIPF